MPRGFVISVINAIKTPSALSPCSGVTEATGMERCKVRESLEKILKYYDLTQYLLRLNDVSAINDAS